MARFTADQTVYSRFHPYEAYTVVSSDGVVVIVRDADGNETGRIVGDLTSQAPAVSA